MAAAGIIPLLAYLLPWFGASRLSLRWEQVAAPFTKRGWLVSGLEMLLMGTLAAAVVYAVGDLGAIVLGNADL